MNMVLVLLSGGLDSVCTLGVMTKETKKIKALTIDYNQSNAQEINQSQDICEYLGIDQEIFSIQDPYERWIEGTSGIHSILPFRNGLFITIGVARLGKHRKIVLGLEADNNIGMFDTGVPFLKSMEDTIEKGLGRRVTIWTPAHNNIQSYDLVRKGYEAIGDVIFDSHSCYNNSNIQCGKCMVCRERHTKIIRAGIEDKTHYTQVPKPLPYQSP